MARGVRRTHTEKLQSELSEVRAAISQYEDSLDELRSREKEINSQIEIERFKEVSELLKQRGMTLCDLKELLSSRETQQPESDCSASEPVNAGENFLRSGHTQSHGGIGAAAHSSEAALCRLFLDIGNCFGNRIPFQKPLFHTEPQDLRQRLGLLTVNKLFYKPQL